MKMRYLLLIGLCISMTLAQAQEGPRRRQVWGTLDIEGTNPYKAPAPDSGYYGVYDDLRISALLSYQPLPMWQFGAGLSFTYGDTDFHIAPRSAILDARVFPLKDTGLFGNARLSIPISRVRGGVFNQYGTLSLTLGMKFEGFPIPLPYILDDIVLIVPFAKIVMSAGGRLDFLTGRRGELKLQPGVVIRLGVDL